MQAMAMVLSTAFAAAAVMGEAPNSPNNRARKELYPKMCGNSARVVHEIAVFRYPPALRQLLRRRVKRVVVALRRHGHGEHPAELHGKAQEQQYDERRPRRDVHLRPPYVPRRGQPGREKRQRPQGLHSPEPQSEYEHERRPRHKQRAYAPGGTARARSALCPS